MAEDKPAGNEDVDAILASLGKELDRNDTDAKRTRDHEMRVQDGKSRTALAKIIVYAFVGMIAALFLYAISLAMFSDCAGCAVEVPKSIIYLGEFTSSVMLPVVTLVLGYYFGTRQDGNNG
ncbi:MAG: hypothetical protein Tsb008_17590 [Rhodothalassiaceae bacterium]